jgi:hypothetical protein
MMPPDDPRHHTEQALAAFGRKLDEPDGESVCAACSHPKHLHAVVGDWCARCAKRCRFIAGGAS